MDSIEVFYKGGDGRGAFEPGNFIAEHGLGELDAQQILASVADRMFHGGRAGEFDALGGQLDRSAGTNRLGRFDAQTGFGDVDTFRQRETGLAVFLPGDPDGADVGDAAVAAEIMAGGHSRVESAEIGRGCRETPAEPPKKAAAAKIGRLTRAVRYC